MGKIKLLTSLILLEIIKSSSSSNEIIKQAFFKLSKGSEYLRAENLLNLYQALGYEITEEEIKKKLNILNRKMDSFLSLDEILQGEFFNEKISINDANVDIGLNKKNDVLMNETFEVDNNEKIFLEKLFVEFKNNKKDSDIQNNIYRNNTLSENDKNNQIFDIKYKSKDDNDLNFIEKDFYLKSNIEVLNRKSCENSEEKKIFEIDLLFFLKKFYLFFLCFSTFVLLGGVITLNKKLFFI